MLAIRDDGDAPCVHVRQLPAERLADIESQLADLTALRETVAALHDRADSVDPDLCSAERVCRYL